MINGKRKEIEGLIYNLKKSRKAKNLRIRIDYEGNILATIPYGIDESLADNFIKEKRSWIERKINDFEKNRRNIVFKGTRKDFLECKNQSLSFVKARIDYFNNTYGFRFNKITVRDQKTRWGSCSQKGNLSFNYRIIFLPENIADYLVVHELCHLRELNHSKRFWDLITRSIPDCKEARKKLKDYIITEI